MYRVCVSRLFFACYWVRATLIRFQKYSFSNSGLVIKASLKRDQLFRKEITHEMIKKKEKKIGNNQFHHKNDLRPFRTVAIFHKASDVIIPR